MSYFPPCLLFPDGHFETTFLTPTATTSSLPTASSPHEPQKREVCALRHEQPGVWLPGQPDAHHKYQEDTDGIEDDKQNILVGQSAWETKQSRPQQSFIARVYLIIT